MEHADGVYSSIILHRRPWNLFCTIQKQDAGDGGFLGSAIFVDMDAWLFDIRAGRDGLPMDILYSGNSLYLSTGAASTKINLGIFQGTLVILGPRCFGTLEGPQDRPGCMRGPRPPCISL